MPSGLISKQLNIKRCHEVRVYPFEGIVKKSVNSKVVKKNLAKVNFQSLFCL